MRIADVQLGLAAQARCASSGTFGYFLQIRVSVGCKRVKRIDALANGGRGKTFG